MSKERTRATNKKEQQYTHLMTFLIHKSAALLLFTGLADVDDVGEEVVVLDLGHGLAELRGILEHADQNLQAVLVGML